MNEMNKTLYKTPITKIIAMLELEDGTNDKYLELEFSNGKDRQEFISYVHNCKDVDEELKDYK